jgi:hypothetical protein
MFDTGDGGAAAKILGPENKLAPAFFVVVK